MNDRIYTPAETETEVPCISARPLSSLELPSKDDPNELLRHRFLCRGGGLLVAAPTGIGKSSFIIQESLLWALGKPGLSITPTRPLRSLIIQAENDDGDLAEMRDGVLRGMDFTDDERTLALESVLVYSESRLTSEEFVLHCVKPLLEKHKPDLLIIDPALAFIGADVREQLAVGSFLRNHLNPLLQEHKCGGIIIHHTNKPPGGREKPDWMAGDFAYLGSGSAEWANWARAVLAIRSLGSHDVFQLYAGKRGQRLDWRDANDEKVNFQYIAHSERGICWVEAEAPETKTGRPSKVADISAMNLHTFLAKCPKDGEGKNEIAQRLNDWLADQDMDVSLDTCKRAVEAMVKSRKLAKKKGCYWKGSNA